MQRLEVSGAVRPIYGSLGVKRLTTMFNAVACSARCALVSSIEFEVCVKRRVPLLPWGRVAGRPEMTLEAQSLAYIPGVCVFPARSDFTPGWAYEHSS